MLEFFSNKDHFDRDECINELNNQAKSGSPDERLVEVIKGRLLEYGYEPVQGKDGTLKIGRLADRRR